MRITEAFIERAKHALETYVMSCTDVLEDDDPLKAFSEGLLILIIITVWMLMIQSGVNITLRKMMTLLLTL